uniref:Uncharacterized protein n=1 Tax=Cacopsylla melanoneura TaxID=428564 RepID=A0A8D9F8A9_9HEMI
MFISSLVPALFFFHFSNNRPITSPTSLGELGEFILYLRAHSSPLFTYCSYLCFGPSFVKAFKLLLVKLEVVSFVLVKIPLSFFIPRTIVLTILLTCCGL